MWRDTDDEVNTQNIAKVDRSAALRRSTIRRETSVRPGRDNVSNQSATERIIARSRTQNMRRIRERLLQEDQQVELEISRLQGELAQLEESRRRNRARAAETRARERAERDGLRTALTQAYDTNTIDQDTSAGEAASSAETVRQHLPRPSRESNLRFEVPVSRSSSPWRYQVLARTSIPSPPHSSGSEHRNRSIPDGPLPFDESPMPALTEGFAPAQQPPADANISQLPPRVEDDTQGLETPPPETWEASYPPLRRVNHMSPRPLPRVDGLGDRRRSPSPSSSLLEEDTWATLLTNLDAEHASSTTSTSFVSTQPDTQTRSGRSSQNTTTTSFGEIGSSDEACDLDLPPGITEEDVLEMRARHRPHREHSGVMTGRQGLQEHRDRIQSRLLRAILDRARRQEEIPDEWWATVGLSSEIDHH